MDKQEAWEQFTKTGSVNDYLNYATQGDNNSFSSTKDLGEFLNNANNNRCSGGSN